MKKQKPKRFYTKKSWKLMRVVRTIVVVLTTPLWFPFYALTYIGMWMENVLDFLDDLLDKILDKIIPQLK